jgi:hypothetical protein
MLLGDAYVEAPVGERAGEGVEPGRAEHGGGDRDDAGPLPAGEDQRVSEHLGPRTPRP